MCWIPSKGNHNMPFCDCQFRGRLSIQVCLHFCYDTTAVLTFGRKDDTCHTVSRCASLAGRLNNVQMWSAKHTTVFQPGNIPVMCVKRGATLLLQGERVIYVLKELHLTLPEDLRGPNLHPLPSTRGVRLFLPPSSSSLGISSALASFRTEGMSLLDHQLVEDPFVLVRRVSKSTLTMFRWRWLTRRGSDLILTSV